MGKLNLYERPYHLNEDDVRWVQETLAGMTLEEKIGQVFFAIGLTDSDEDALAMVEDLHIGGIMYRPNQAEKLKRRNDKIQAAAKIPLLIAANLEAGGSGALVEGTPFGSQRRLQPGLRAGVRHRPQLAQPHHQHPHLRQRPGGGAEHVLGLSGRHLEAWGGGLHQALPGRWVR